MGKNWSNGTQDPTDGASTTTTDLTRLSLKVSYRSGDSDILNEFYIPCLQQSVIYKRAVGFFTSAGLAEAARGLLGLIKNGGRMYLIVSAKLNFEDVEKIRAGYDAREIIARSLERGLDEPIIDEADSQRVRNLTWLIANNKLDIRIARPTSWTAEGIYHEKMGLFFDSYDERRNVVAFTGSMNETKDSLIRNYESIDVSISWEKSNREMRRVTDHAEHFRRMWEGTEPGLETLEFPEAVRRKLVKLFRPPAVPAQEPEARRSPYPFQLKAIDAWKKAHFKGVLAMATGCGKTYTAIKSLEEIPEHRINLIIVPQQDLIDQWEKEIRAEYGNDCVIRKVSSLEPDWPGQLDRLIAAYQSKATNESHRIFVIATIQTASGESFRRRISRLGPVELAMVVDEVHHSGAGEFSKVFGINASVRLGLSATPERNWDDEGNQRIFDFFGPQFYDYGIADAIRDGNLTAYRYEIHPAALTTTEREEFRKFSQRIQVLISKAKKRYPFLGSRSVPQIMQYLDQVGDRASQQLRGLYLARVNLLKKATNKVEALRDIFRHYKLKRCIIYCNDLEHLDECRQAVFEEGFDPVEYSSRIDPAQRRVIRTSFDDEEGLSRILVAVKCLDEGVDIPTCDSAILIASSKSSREFIQRRGRVLRKHPSKSFSEIHDILILPFVLSEDAYPLTDSEFEAVNSEFRRAEEFAQNAQNGPEILKYISQLRLLFETARIDGGLANRPANHAQATHYQS